MNTDAQGNLIEEKRVAAISLLEVEDQILDIFAERKLSVRDAVEVLERTKTSVMQFSVVTAG